MAEVQFAPGVTIRTIDSRGKVYRGTALALADAGLAAPHEFPGQPGVGMTMASYKPDGTRVPQGGSHAWKLEGYRKIVRVGFRGLFEVVVQQSRDEQERCRARWDAEWEEQKRLRAARVSAVTPSPAHAPMPVRRSHLTLVWSAPT